MRIKRNEKQVYLIEFILALAVVVLALFFHSLASGVKAYYIATILGVLLVVVIMLFGYHRDKHYLRVYASRIVVSWLLLAFIVSFGLGLLVNFTHSSFSLDPNKLLVDFLPVLILSCVVEMVRHIIFHSYFRSLRPAVVFVIIIIIANIIIATNARSFLNPEATFVTICTVVLPILATELLCGYLNYMFGLRPALIYKLVVRLYPFVLPILPNLGPFIYAVFAVTLPTAIFFFTYRLNIATKKDQKIIQRRNWLIVLIPTVAMLAVIVSLVSGVFGHQIIAIASDSMNPAIARGDAVIFEKTAADKIKENDILVFKHEGIIVTHRVVLAYIENDCLYFVTKGDNSETNDNFRISESEVVGRVAAIYKYIGYPTVWLNESLKTE